MIGQPKPLASLSSTLLARKGTARPAMRPQGFGGFGSLPGAHDDLGWNDMGEPHEAHADDVQPVPPPVLLQREVLREEFEAPEPVKEQAEPVSEAAGEKTPVAAPEPVFESILAVKKPTVAAVVAPVATEVTPEPVVALPPARVERTGRETKTKQARAAFTLRLDSDRHLHLRLASALKHRSAQQLVTAALDAFLDTVPEVAELARRLPPRAGH